MDIYLTWWQGTTRSLYADARSGTQCLLVGPCQKYQLVWQPPRPPDKIRQRRMRLAGRCVWHPELTAREVILWEPSHGKRPRGRPHATFVGTLKGDTGPSSASEIRTLMVHRNQKFPSWRRLTSLQRKKHWLISQCPRQETDKPDVYGENSTVTISCGLKVEFCVENDSMEFLLGQITRQINVLY